MSRALLILIIFAAACSGEPVYIPKPRMFPRIEYPDRTMRQYELEGCPYQLEFPDYARMERDSTFFQDEAPNPCWFNLQLPVFNGTIYFSYYPIEDRTGFDKLVDDAFKLTGKHQIRADYVEEERIRNSEGVDGFIFHVKGPSASPLQFYVTDSTSHFLRGALYFNQQVRPDSMAPVYEFVEEDIYRMISSFRWVE